ncbi:hypothetical protein Hte_002325 [Hypoxylon texense]
MADAIPSRTDTLVTGKPIRSSATTLRTTEISACVWQLARELFEALGSLSRADDALKLDIGFSLFELRKNTAFDLLNERTECHIRQGPDGKTYIRGQAEVLEGRKVRVRPLSQRACWTYESSREELRQGLGKRAVGTHAVLRLEIVDRQLTEARDVLVDRESELVPVGKRATDSSIEEQTRAVMRGADGTWEARVAAAEDSNAVLRSSKAKCLGAKMVFVDLAGAEYHQENGAQTPLVKQTPQERQEGHQINADLLALKEVIRAGHQTNRESPSDRHG